jgi:hypothetical protein
VKIGDLGVARELGSQSFAETTVGSFILLFILIYGFLLAPYNLSPELVKSRPYNEKSL